MKLHTHDFDYHLPPELIAQTPVEPRDTARLLVLKRSNGTIEHKTFRHILDYLHEGDVMVFNDSRVIPARLAARKTGTGGAVEILLLRQVVPNTWETLVKPGRRVKKGTMLELGDGAVTAEVMDEGDAGARTIRFSRYPVEVTLGQIALPPYIHVPLNDPERYQTVYSEANGSVAAPTAGLHFTPSLLEAIQAKGIKCLFVTLHIGLDTFRPVSEDDPREHRIHSEYGTVSADTASQLTQARTEHRRIICVGTTSVRMVEAAAQASPDGTVKPFNGWVDLFILPGHRFKMVDSMVTNFHLPRSTLLMLVSAFAGKEIIDRAYQEAISQKYRFYSFGDAMLII